MNLDPYIPLIPRDLPDLLTEHGRIGLGFDVATTEKKHSNPSSLALIQQAGANYCARWIATWKSADPSAAEGIIRALLHVIAPRKARRLCIDASNEKYFATSLKKSLGGLLPVTLVTSSEKLVYLGEPMPMKAYLGSLLVNTIEDGNFVMPDESWVKDDFRRVKQDKGSFVTDLGPNGEHGDTFDACKLALHALTIGGGPVEASAAQLGTYLSHPTQGRWKNPFLARIREGARINA